jgi:ATP-binding cassette subfamily B protein
VCIARALAASPQLLVLDEPTSGLDGQSEAQIQASLEELGRDVTLVIIAHRLSTLSLCDRILILNDGRMEAFDTADTLERTNEFFQEAVRIARAGVEGVLPQ